MNGTDEKEKREPEELHGRVDGWNEKNWKLKTQIGENEKKEEK